MVGSEYQIVPATPDMLPDILALEEACFSSPWTRKMLEAELTHKLPGEKPEVFGDVFPEGTVAYSQLLERGGKLDARVRKARSEAYLIE